MALKTIIVTRHHAALDWIEKHHPKLIFPDGGRVHYVINGEVEHGIIVNRDMLTTSIDISPQRIQGSHIVHVSNELVGSDEVKIISHATPEDVVGARVIGILPEELSSLAAEYWKLSLVVPAKYRGKELTVEDMERFGCSLKRIWVYLEDPLQGKIVVDPTRDGFNCPFYTPEGYSGVCVCTDKSQNPRW